MLLTASWGRDTGMSGGSNALRDAVDVQDMLYGEDSDGSSGDDRGSSGDDRGDEDDECDDIASGDDESGSAWERKRGRPSDVKVDEEQFRARCNDDPPPTNKELTDEFGCTRNHVQYLKNKLRCGQQQTERDSCHADLVHSITFESLQDRWVREEGGGLALHRLPVPKAVNTLAAELGIGVQSLRKRMKEVKFDPKHPYPLSHVETMVRKILETHSCGQLGANFMEAKLRLPPFNAVVRTSLIRQALKNVDPHNSVRRRKPEKKKPAQYTVKGARSLYHIDAHEKLAKLWGEKQRFPCRVYVRRPHVTVCVHSSVWIGQVFGSTAA